MYLDVARQRTIVLNSHKPAPDLLEHRANNYSDRPRFVNADEIPGDDLTF